MTDTPKIVQQVKQLAELRQQRILQPFAHVGELMRDARKRQQLTIDDLARYSNASEVTIGKIKHGATNVTVSKLKAVLSAQRLSLWIS